MSKIKSSGGKFCQSEFIEDHFPSFCPISDDGVLSHREFIVVMKNQLVRGLENVRKMECSH